MIYKDTPNVNGSALLSGKRLASRTLLRRMFPFFRSSNSRSSLHLLIILLHLLLNSGVADAISVQNALGYVPSKPAAIVVAILYLLFSVIHFVSVFRYRNWWGLCLPIGALGSAFGYILRYLIAEPKHQDSRGLLTAEQILVLCCPAAFLAFNYIVHGRLLQTCIGARHSLIRPNWISTFFVLSDFVTFIVQAGGAALVLQPAHTSTGRTVVKAGVVLQTMSFVIFCGFLVWTWLSVKREKLATGREVWWKGYMTLAFSSAFILVRAIYRMVASLAGPTSSLSSDEVFLYVLDVLPLMIAIGIYVPFWPGKYMDGKDSIVNMTHEQYKLAPVLEPA